MGRESVAVRNGAYISQFLDETAHITRELSRHEVDRASDILLDAWRRGSIVFVMAVRSPSPEGYDHEEPRKEDITHRIKRSSGFGMEVSEEQGRDQILDDVRRKVCIESILSIACEKGRA